VRRVRPAVALDPTLHARLCRCIAVVLGVSTPEMVVGGCEGAFYDFGRAMMRLCARLACSVG
jgi:hypothetical protein